MPDETLTPFKMSSFMSVIRINGWLGISASLLREFYSFYLQQWSPENTTQCVTLQTVRLRILKRLGATIRYPNLLLQLKVLPQASQSSSIVQKCRI